MKLDRSRLISHRGLFNNYYGILDNSRVALLNSVKYKMDIELDIHLTKDDTLVLNHDPDIYGMRIRESTYDELLVMKPGLFTFKSALRLISGFVGISIEVKSSFDDDQYDNEILQKLKDDLSDYKGRFEIISMNPKVIKSASELFPKASLGLISYSFNDYSHLDEKLRYDLTNLVIIPELKDIISFVSYNHKDMTDQIFDIVRNNDLGLYGWTFRLYDTFVDTTIYDKIIVESSYISKDKPCSSRFTRDLNRTFPLK